MPLMSDHADQCLPEGHFDKGCGCCEDQTTTFALQSGLDHCDEQVAWFPHILLCPPFSPVLVLSSISLPSQIIFLSNLKTLEHQSVKTKAYFSSFFFFQKTGQGSRHWLKLAYTGTCWPTLAREWYRLNGCQVIEDCQNNFKWPLSPSLLLFHSPLLSFLLSYCHCLFAFHSLSFSSSLCLFLLAVFISCSESVNLMKRKVKHLAGIRKHPCDNYVCVSCVWASTESRFILYCKERQVVQLTRNTTGG